MLSCIGVTPIIPMAAEAAARHLDYQVHYSGHEGRMAFLPELHAAHGERLVTHVSESDGRIDLDALFSTATPGSHVYCCGPAGFIDAVEAAATAARLDFHTERFEAETLTPQERARGDVMFICVSRAACPRLVLDL